VAGHDETSGMVMAPLNLAQSSQRYRRPRGARLRAPDCGTSPTPPGATRRPLRWCARPSAACTGWAAITP